MRRPMLGLLLALALAFVTHDTSFAEPRPEFRLGFKALASQIPEIVGAPLDNERFNPANGDSMQRTSHGLLVWRKADNFAAFTDGKTTWIDGPLGLQSRPNDARFDWENTQATASLSDGAVTLDFSRGPDGIWMGRGSVRNSTTNSMDVEINVLALLPGGSPLMDAPTSFVWDLPPGTTRPIAVRVPTKAPSATWRWVVSSHPTSVRNGFSMDVGSSKKLRLDAALAGAVAELSKLDDGASLVRAAAEEGVTLAQGNLPPGVLGDFIPAQRLVILSNDLELTSVWVRASVLSHELQHAAAASNNLPQTPAQCLQAESNAFSRQSEVWTRLWQANLPADVDTLHAELNDVTRTIEGNPALFAAELTDRYLSECGPLP